MHKYIQSQRRFLLQIEIFEDLGESLPPAESLEENLEELLVSRGTLIAFVG